MRRAVLFIVLALAVMAFAMNPSLSAQAQEDTPFGEDGLPIGHVEVSAEEDQTSVCRHIRDSDGQASTWGRRSGVLYESFVKFRVPEGIKLVVVQTEDGEDIAGSAWVRHEGDVIRLNEGGRIYGFINCTNDTLMQKVIRRFGPFEEAHIRELADELGLDPEPYLNMPNALLLTCATDE
jgi:hypothetical protein